MSEPTENPAGDNGLEARPDIVPVLFKGRRVEPYLNPRGVPAEAGRRLVVEVERGVDLGEAAPARLSAMVRRRDGELREIVREAGPEDVECLARIREEDGRSLEIVKERVEHFRLPMHMVDAEHQFDGNRVTFYFTADHRIDFRELVRDLAGIFRTRIELRQIGAREAARRLGGLGACGREICCCSFLCDFERVTLQMARERTRDLSPSRISGVCGRLLCCLIFEGCARPCREERPADDALGPETP